LNASYNQTLQRPPYTVWAPAVTYIAAAFAADAAAAAAAGLALLPGIDWWGLMVLGCGLLLVLLYLMLHLLRKRSATARWVGCCTSALLLLH
jgi:hypothetical protein